MRRIKATFWQAFNPKESITPVKISHDIMCSLENWSKESEYTLLFATKSGIPIPRFPITHSAIALHNVQDGTFAVYGRQSPFDVSQWLSNGIAIRTRKDNENRYLNKNFSFTGYPTNVAFSLKEIESVLDEADTLINEQQYCNMIHSNCYSYSTTVMALFVRKLLDRPVFDSEAILHVLEVIEQHPLTDHFSIGVLNNSIVVDKLLSVLLDIQIRIHLISNKSDHDRNLQQFSSALMVRVGGETAKQNCLESQYDSPRV